MLKNDNFLRALTGSPITRQPIWLMRQAGRYLPEYRAIREKAGSFLKLCKTPELACEVTLQPLNRFDLDAAILFSDILTIPDAMGMELNFIENEGPRFNKTLQTEHDIRQLPVPDPTVELRYVGEAIRLIQHALHQRIPLIGFAGSPWTIACYMLEGGSSGKQFERARKMIYQQPDILHLLLEKITSATEYYLQAQISAGVDAVMLFDTWGGLLGPNTYQDFSLKYMQRIIHYLKQSNPKHPTPILLFTKNGGLWLEKIIESGCNGVGIDWTMDLAKAAQVTKNHVTLQGNLDPLALFAPEHILKQEIERIMLAVKDHPRFIFNLGHGILPTTPPESVQFLIETVHNYKR